MYHEVPQAHDEAARSYFAVPVERFADQMARLRDEGLRAVSLETMLETRDPDLVALTFDDGHQTHYASAFPVLAAMGFSATFFVTTGWVGRRASVSWNQLQEMAAAGMSIQSHTHTHPFLSALDGESVARELRESKRQLDEHLAQDTVTLALPGGDAPRRRYSDAIATSGYRIVATSAWGTNAWALRGAGAPVVVRRYTVRQDTSLKRFADLAMGLSPWWSREGLRLRTLNEVRRVFGPERYARWRRALLQTVRR
jgi:peptidoglycan/xylan/chitin deacetylase (PgdA/CDA1 family)